MHQRGWQRDALLAAEIASFRARLRLRQQQRLGNKTQTHPTPGQAQPPTKTQPQRPRRQQPGQPAPTRRDHSHLPAVEEVIDRPEGQRPCSCCGLPFVPLAGTEEGQVLEIDVSVCRRVYRRRRYRPTCRCQANPGILTAKAPDKLIARSTRGLSIWVEVLTAYLQAGARARGEAAQDRSE